MFHSSACKQSPPAELSASSVVLVSLALPHFIAPCSPAFPSLSPLSSLTSDLYILVLLCHCVRAATQRVKMRPLRQDTMIQARHFYSRTEVSLFFFLTSICYTCRFSHLEYVIVSLQELIFTSRRNKQLNLTDCS